MNLSLLTLIIVLVVPQARNVEIRATGQGASKELALADATRKAWQQASAYFRDLPEVKELRLKPDELDAFLAAILQGEEQSARSGAVDIVIHFDPVRTVRRVGALHKDQETANAIVETWKQMQDARLTPTELGVKHLAAQVYAALGKTEESMGSNRVASNEESAKAKQSADAAVTMGPNIADAHYAMGDVLIDAEDVKAAEAEYRKALSINPNSSFGHARLAGALRVAGQLTESIAELREALRIDPKSASSHTDLGLILAAQGNAAEAVAEFQEALRVDPDFVDAHNNLAIAFSRQRRTPAAVDEFREIVRIDPDSALGYYNLGVALADMEKDQESAAALREVVRINPNHFNAHYNLGELLRLEEKYDDAVRQFQEYLRLAPDTPQNQRNIRRAKDFVQKYETR
jgi:tetratricopeptide (TPR) repeat protein